MSYIPDPIKGVLKFLVVLGILIFVHELGHFLMARLCRVRVKKFYLGFDIMGLKLLRFRAGPTEYGIGILPLGGYVKMAGQEDLPSDDEEAKKKILEEDRAIPDGEKFDRKPLWQRALIIAAGPVMNVLLGLVLFILIACHGVTVFKPYQGTNIGNVEPGSPAAAAGILPGDKIVSVDGETMGEWSDFLLSISTWRADSPVAIVYLRDGEERRVEVAPRILPGTTRPRIGVAPAGRAAVWVEDTDSPAARSGLRAGMIVNSIDGRSLPYPALEEEIASRPSRSLRLGVEDPESGKTFEVEAKAETRTVVPGLHLEEGTVRAVDYRARFDAAALRPGDRIARVNGEETSPDRLQEIISSTAPGSELRLIIERSARLFFLPSQAVTATVTVAAEGYIPGIAFDYYPDTVTARYRGWAAVRYGFAETVKMVKTIFSFLYYLLVGRASPTDLAGPVRIFDLTRQFKLISIAIVHFLAMISVNLAVVNLFPLPVLDGGHILFILIEAVRRRPLSERAIVVAHQIGLGLLLLLFLLVTYNDIIQVFFRR
jgi:regulator of sigma E protease